MEASNSTEKAVEKKPKFSMLLQEHEDGTRTISAVTADDTAMTFSEQRTLLRWAEDKVQDMVMATFVSKLLDSALQQKIKPAGWREKSVLDFLR